MPPRLRIDLDGQAWTAPGAVLEGLWQAGDALLAATTDDVPQEDALHFALLGPPGPALEHVTLMAAYATGVFRPEGVEGAALRFRFFDAPPWRLEVLARPAPHLPLAGDPAGATRPFTLRTRLKLRDAPR